MFCLFLYPRLFFFLPHTINVIHMHCWLTGTLATVK